MKQLNISWIVFGVFLVLFYILNSFTDIAIDDFVYKHLITNDPSKIGTRVSGLGDIISSMQLHYFTTNGRLLINGLAQLFLISDNKIIFDVVNTLMLGLLFILVCLHAGLRLTKMNLANALFLMLGFWFLLPGANHTLLWVDGSINYLWATNFVLLFLWVYKRLAGNEKSTSYAFFPLLFVFGFACGYTHEVITVGVSGALFLYYITNLKKIKSDIFILVSGFMFGTLLLIIAPGNFVRLEDGAEKATGIVQLLIQRCGIILSVSDYFAFVLLLLVVLAIKFKKPTYLNSFFKENWLFVSSILISFLFIFLAGAYQPRVFFGVAVFSLILLLIIFNAFRASLNITTVNLVLGILCIAMLVEWIGVRSDLKANYVVFNADEQIWRESPQHVFPDRQKKINRFVSTGLGGIDQDFWSNKAMSWYYKKDYMVFIPEGLYAELNTGNNFGSKKINVTQRNPKLGDSVFTADINIDYDEKSGYFSIPVSNSEFDFKKARIHFEGVGLAARATSVKDKLLKTVLKRVTPAVNNENGLYYCITLHGKKYIVFQKPQQLSPDKPLSIALFDPNETLLVQFNL